MGSAGRRGIAAMGIGLALALALWLAFERGEVGREAPPAEDGPISRGGPPGAVQGPSGVEEAGEKAAARRPDGRDAERALLTGQLARVLPETLSVAELQRLAELLLEARDLRGEEPPRIEREIQMRIAEEFERISGEPIGRVASRLSTRFDGAPRPPRVPDPSDSTP